MVIVIIKYDRWIQMIEQPNGQRRSMCPVIRVRRVNAFVSRDCSMELSSFPSPALDHFELNLRNVCDVNIIFFFFLF